MLCYFQAMPVFDTFSRRSARKAATESDPLVYDEMPHPFRAQVVHIWSDSIGPYELFKGMRCNGPINDAWDWIAKTAAREAGLPELPAAPTPDKQCERYLYEVTDPNAALDLIEISMIGLHRYLEPVWEKEDKWTSRTRTADRVRPAQATEELNARFAQHSLGYQFVEGQLIRLDSEHVHAEVVAPALALLRSAQFAGAEQEYQSAHEHYRHGRHKEAMNDALKAFESTLKTICDERGWTYASTATASKLVDLVFEKELVPSSQRSHFDSVRAALQSGLGTLRNKMSAHGQGASIEAVPRYLAAHALHLAAANILLLVAAHEENA